MLSFLKNEAKVELANFSQNPEKISTIEFSFKSASFECFCFLLEDYINTGFFLKHPKLLHKILQDFQRACKFFIINLLKVSGNFKFESDKAILLVLKKNFEKSVKGKIFSH